MIAPMPFWCGCFFMPCYIVQNLHNKSKILILDKVEYLGIYFILKIYTLLKGCKLITKNTGSNRTVT